MYLCDIESVPLIPNALSVIDMLITFSSTDLKEGGWIWEPIAKQ